MKKANLHEAKTNLSKLVEMAIAGEDVIICRAGEPIAKIIPFTVSKKKRIPGQYKGKIKIEDDFEDMPESFLRNFK